MLALSDKLGLRTLVGKASDVPMAVFNLRLGIGPNDIIFFIFVKSL